MKRLLPLIIMLFLIQSVTGQVLERRYMEHDGLNRTYLIYIPSTYNPDVGEEVPLIFAFHGINATDENLVGVGLNAFAERENFIVIYPQAAQVEFGFLAWNCGTPLATNVDDTGFINALIDNTMAGYNIDDSRIYTCGFSMGGMMSNRLGCELSDRIAAVASVSGPITQYVYSNCEPTRPVPYMHFHGTADETVPYSGIGVVGIKSAEATVQWWAQRSSCDINYDVDPVPDTADAWYHVDRYIYPGCSDESEVIHHRIQYWPHSWPGPSRNVYATAEIVKFFLRHELRESVILTSVSDIEQAEWAPRPNPFSASLDISHLAALQQEGPMRWQVFDAKGGLMADGRSPRVLDTQAWPNGFYFFRLETDQGSVGYKLVK